MHSTEPRRFDPTLRLSQCLMMAASYLPYALLREAEVLGTGRWVLLGIGVYLSLALLLRNLTSLDQRLPLWLKWCWLGVDFAVWWYSQEMTRWGTGTLYTGLLLTVDATMLGWHRWRGVIPFTVMSALTTLGPLLVGSRTGRAFWVSYVTTLTPSYFFVYGFVYMAGRMGEERAATSRARKEAELANVHLREYATQVEELAVLRERNRLAREVHDTVAHGFTGIIMQMEAVSRMLTKSPAKAESALRLIQEQARESLAEVRRSVHALRPLQMEERKGVAALRRLVEEFSSTTGMDADILVEGAPVELPAGHDLCLYRTVQEGLTNAFRHGRADQARVRLRFAVDHVVAAVEDNGRPAAQPHEPGLGIIGVRERAEVLGGIVAAGPGRAGGFVLQLTLPLAQPGGVGIA